VAQLLLNVFTVFTQRVHKLKQSTNLRLYDENCTSLLSHYCFHEMGVGEGGCSFERGTYFKFRPIVWHFFEGGTYSSAMKV